MTPSVQYNPGDKVLVTYYGEMYRGIVQGPAKAPTGSYRVWRLSKQQLPSGWGLEDARIEIVHPDYLNKIQEQTHDNRTEQ